MRAYAVELENTGSQGPRLSPLEVDAVFAFCMEYNVNTDASKPAMPVFWFRPKGENEC